MVRTWAHVPGIAWDASETCMEFKGCLNLCLSTMCWKRSLWTDHKLFASFVIPPPKCARKQWALRSISCPSKALLMLHKVKHTWAAGLRDGGGEQPAWPPYLAPTAKPNSTRPSLVQNGSKVRQPLRLPGSSLTSQTEMLKYIKDRAA